MKQLSFVVSVALLSFVAGGCTMRYEYTGPTLAVTNSVAGTDLEVYVDGRLISVWRDQRPVGPVRIAHSQTFLVPLGWDCGYRSVQVKAYRAGTRDYIGNAFRRAYVSDYYGYGYGYGSYHRRRVEEWDVRDLRSSQEPPLRSRDRGIGYP